MSSLHRRQFLTNSAGKFCGIAIRAQAFHNCILTIRRQDHGVTIRKRPRHNELLANKIAPAHISIRQPAVADEKCVEKSEIILPLR